MSQKRCTDINQIKDLLIRIDKYCRKYFSRKQACESDKKKFEVDVKYFNMQFQNSQKKLKPKYDFFFGPYQENNQQIMKDLRHYRSKHRILNISENKVGEIQSPPI